MAVPVEEIEYAQERNQAEERLNALIEKYADSAVKGNFLVFQIYFYDPLLDMWADQRGRDRRALHFRVCRAADRRRGGARAA